MFSEILMQTRLATAVMTSVSQTRMTRQPSRWNSWVVRRSRAMLASIFGIQ
jgi:hypothetical protein